MGCRKETIALRDACGSLRQKRFAGARPLPEIIGQFADHPIPKAVSDNLVPGEPDIVEQMVWHIEKALELLDRVAVSHYPRRPQQDHLGQPREPPLVGLRLSLEKRASRQVRFKMHVFASQLNADQRSKALLPKKRFWEIGQLVMVVVHSSFEP